MRWRERWTRRGTAETAEVDGTDRVVTLPGVAHPEEIRHGLACGAHRQVMNGRPWNDLRPPGPDRAEVALMLADDWGVSTAQEWRSTVEALAEARFSEGDVFTVRQALSVHQGRVSRDAWVAAVETASASHGLGPEQTTSLVAEARRVDAYEDLLRERGLLHDAEQVPSLVAWDWARGVNMARDGLRAGFCDEPTAWVEVARFGRLVREHYTSWSEFGVSFTLGRLLWSYDQYEELVDWGSAVTVDRTLGLQRILTRDPSSPWRVVPFHRTA